MTATYIAFEGIDGSGKTKQLSLLAAHLQQQDFKVLITKEFGSPHDLACEKLREFALNSVYGFDELAGQFMFAACSTQHSERVLTPAMEQYDFILSDRSIESNLAYGPQVIKPSYPDLSLEERRKIIHSLFFLDQRRVKPNTIVYLDVNPEVSWARVNGRAPEQFEEGTDRIEARGLELQQGVRDEYYLRIEQNPSYVVIDCNTLDVEQTHNMIVERLGV